MKTDKQDTLDRVAELPDDVTIEQILYDLYFRLKISRSLEQVDRGEVLTTEEVMKRLNRWVVTGEPL